MTTTLQEQLELPAPHRFTRNEYYLMAESGVFGDRRVELIDGEVIDMSPQRDNHAVALGLVNAALQATFVGHWIRLQSPLTFGEYTEPEPDVAVVTGSPRDYSGLGRHPNAAVLVVEIAGSSLRSDRKNKAMLYSRAGIEDYWILNLIDRQLEVHRQPTPTGYQSVTILTPPEFVSPLAQAAASIAVSDMLP